MNQLQKTAQERMNELSAIIESTQSRLQTAPDGRIVTHRRPQGVYYTFHETPDNTRHTPDHSAGVPYRSASAPDHRTSHYLSKSDLPLILALAQKDYDLKVLRLAEEEQKKLARFIRTYPDLTPEQVYEQLSSDRQLLVTPIRQPDEVYVRQWLSVDYPKKPFPEDYPELFTSSGERVRSKSEVIIADTLLRMGIPYRYEFPVHFPGAGTFHPDFTVLNVRLRKEYYWEHLGMMADPEYAEAALSKIDIYEKNGCFPGSKLILTHETEKHPLQTRMISAIIQEYLL